jgi:hypothetical protein
MADLPTPSTLEEALAQLAEAHRAVHRELANSKQGRQLLRNALDARKRGAVNNLLAIIAPDTVEHDDDDDDDEPEAAGRRGEDE